MSSRSSVAPHRGAISLEDPEKHQTILEQSIRAFAELGFRGTDVQVIADRAGVGKGTVYRYFGSKEELFWATTYEVILRLDRHIFAAMQAVEGGLAKLRALANAHSEFFQANPHCLEVFVQERAEFRGPAPESHRQHHETMIEKIGEIIQQGIDAGELRPVNTRQTTLTMACLLYGTAVLGCRLEPMALPRMADYAVEILLNGLRAEPTPIEEAPNTDRDRSLKP
jgi:AcrR family transcriptional regulator